MVCQWPGPPARELFFFPLELTLDPNAIESVKSAYEFSKGGHRGQKRIDGSRQFGHPKAAAWIYIDELGGRDPRVIIDILLHDLGEDSHLLTSRRIMMNFGYDIACDLRALTKLAKGKETTEAYLARIVKQGPWAGVTKFCDRVHNLRTLEKCSPLMRREQIEETERYHLPMLVPALAKCGESWATYAAALERMTHEAMDQYR